MRDLDLVLINNILKTTLITTLTKHISLYILETYHRKYHNTFPPPCCLKTSHVFI
jgi:hypothetical protein